MDDADVKNGCLWVIPGSHRSGYLYLQQPHRDADEFDFAAEIYCNAWYLLPWYLAEGKHVASADRRGVVPVTGADPYAWKGYDPVSDSGWLQRCIGR